MRFRPSKLATIFSTALLTACGLGTNSNGLLGGPAAVSGVEPYAGVMPRPVCGPDDLPDTGLQGQVPKADRSSGRAAMGYYCNISMEGTLSTVNGQVTTAPNPQQANAGTVGEAGATLDAYYEDCAYYSDTPIAPAGKPTNDYGGGVAADISDSANPTMTDYMKTPGMVDPWEALRANTAQGLLMTTTAVGGDHNLDVYDIKEDCHHPKLVFQGDMPTGTGHEGWFSPDGKTYWMYGTGIVPVDVTDPAAPKELIAAGEIPGAHGGNVSPDGKRLYTCAPKEAEWVGTGTGVGIFDTTQIQNRVPNPTVDLISTVAIPDEGLCQSLYGVTYKGRKFVIEYGESGAPDKNAPQYSTFSSVHIFDVEDEKNPHLVSVLKMEVDAPENYSQVSGDASPGFDGTIFIYSVHHCSPDRLVDPTILACGNFLSGMRVFDIRDPTRPKELAYYNTGTSGQEEVVDPAVSRAVIFTNRKEVMWTTTFRGLHMGKFRDGVWPFPETPKCPATHDYFFNQYNPTLGCQ